MKPLETAMRNDLAFPRTMRAAFGHDGHAIERFIGSTSGDAGDRLVFWGVIGAVSALVLLGLVRWVLA